MGYHIGLQLEVKGKIKGTSGDFRETNFDLEFGDEEKAIAFSFDIYDRRTLVFKIKRKGYPYGGGFVNEIIEERDEYYQFVMEHFGNVSGRFTIDVLDEYINLFE